MLNIWTSNFFKIGPAKTPAGWNYYRKQTHGIEQTPSGWNYYRKTIAWHRTNPSGVFWCIYQFYCYNNFTPLGLGLSNLKNVFL
jgi:hypothetical protein